MKQNQDITTTRAVVLIGYYHWCVIKNIGRAIDKLVCKHPWVCIVITIVLAFIICFVSISKARAERDSYNKKMLHTQMQLDSYRAVYDNGKEVH